MQTEHQTVEIQNVIVEEVKLPEKRRRDRGFKNWWESHPLARLFQHGSFHGGGSKPSPTAAQKRLKRNKAAKQARKDHRFG